jgi:hypothetical protein
MDSMALTKIGDTLQFGLYAWQVLDIQENKALIISKEILLSKAYHSSGGCMTWENCALREWLNEQFLNSFNSGETANIVESKVVNNDNPEHGTHGGNETCDKIFLLSIEEIRQYYHSIKARIALNDGKASWWWLRSPGSDKYSVAKIGSDGYMDVSGTYVFYDEGGVRPALWLSL